MEQSNNDKVNDDYDKDDGDGDSDDIDDDDVWLNRWVAWPKVTLRGGEKKLGLRWRTSTGRARLTVRITFPEVRNRKGAESGLFARQFPPPLPLHVNK